ncbi:MAG: DNA-3-methyladenine glycosylase 2 family protein [Candidatus Zixiibacteriota bacterium]
MTSTDEAVKHLCKVDARLAEAIEAVGECRLSRNANCFDQLARIIIGQQLSGKAAESIYRKVQGLNKGKLLTPAVIARLTDQQLRGGGLSAAKVVAIRSLAEHVTTKKLQIKKLETMEDHEITERITAVKGMGPWSAQMYLMFVLNRLDVFPMGDLGIRKGMMNLYGKRISEKRMLKISEKWRPYRTVASYYLWRSLDIKPDS